MSKEDAIKFNTRRSSIPYNFFRRSSQAHSSISEEHNHDELETKLTPVEHLEILLADMNDFCEYGAEILNSLKETRKLSANELFKHIYKQNKELKSKILQLQELNEALFNEVFNYINETNVYIDSNVITSDVILSK